MNIIIYICSIKIRLIFELMKEEKEIIEKMSFKDYFESLDTNESNAIRDQMIALSGIAYSTFYDKVRKQNWSPLQLKELCRITNQQFER